MSKTSSIEQLSAALAIAGLGSSSDVPKILLAATDRWYPTAWLGLALAKVGCEVEAVCPPGHPLSLTRARFKLHSYNGLSPLVSISRAIRNANPEIVIPADDLATRHLHELHARECNHGRSGSEICKLIERSLGAADSFAIVRSRNAFMDAAREEGIRVPDTSVILSASDLHSWIAQRGFPTVLKANGTSGGDGVRVVNTVEEAERAFRKLQSPPLIARALKRAAVDRDVTLVWPSLLRRRPVVSAQTFVVGHEATSTIFCWEGQVLASLHFEVLEKMGPAGHATVVRWIDHPEMTAAAEKIARRLNLSGIHGLDFMIEKGSGAAYLIEINPRTTQVGHLGLGSERDLPAALYGAITGKAVHPRPSLTRSETIALFPQEWKRDARSPYLTSAYHDVPWGEPGLVLACASQVRKNATQRYSQPIVPQQTDSTGPIPAQSETSQTAWAVNQQ